MTQVKKSRSSEIDMVNGSIFPKIFAYFIPVMLANMLQTLYNAADQIVVGNYAGSLALGAVGSTASLTNLIISLLIGLSIGTNAVMARSFGAGNTSAVEKTVHTSIAISVIIGAFCGLFGFVFCPQLLRLIGTQDEIFDLAVLYMRVTFAGLPVMSFYNFGSAILRAIGDTRRPLYYLIISGFHNVSLNLVFVVVFHMSVVGVALATVISQCLSAFLIGRRLVLSDGIYKLCFNKIKIHKPELVQIVKIGVPSGIQSSVFSLSSTIIQSGINSINESAVSGCTAASTLDTTIYQCTNSLYHATLAFCGQNYGAGKYDRIMKSFLYCLVISIFVGSLVGWACYIFAEPLLGIFIKDDPLAISYGIERLAVTARVYFFCGVMEVASGALRALNHSVLSLFNALLCSCVFRIVWVNTVFSVYHNIETLFLSFPISWVMTSILHIAFFLVIFKKMKNEQKKKQIQLSA